MPTPCPLPLPPSALGSGHPEPPCSYPSCRWLNSGCGDCSAVPKGLAASLLPLPFSRLPLGQDLVVPPAASYTLTGCRLLPRRTLQVLATHMWPLAFAPAVGTRYQCPRCHLRQERQSELSQLPRKAQACWLEVRTGSQAPRWRGGAQCVGLSAGGPLEEPFPLPPLAWPFPLEAGEEFKAHGSRIWVFPLHIRFLNWHPLFGISSPLCLAQMWGS